jgi:hypothetical protein
MSSETSIIDDILNDVFPDELNDVLLTNDIIVENKKKRTVVCGDLYVSGNLITHGSGTFKSFLEVDCNHAIKKGSQFWNIYSDKRLKKNISNVTSNEIKDYIHVIDKLKVKKFCYKNTDKMQLGLIADEYKKLDSKNVIKQNGYYTIDLNDIFFKLIVYVQQLNKKLKTVENKLNHYQMKQFTRVPLKKIKTRTIAKSTFRPCKYNSNSKNLRTI